jgi:hypothetical protein
MTPLYHGTLSPFEAFVTISIVVAFAVIVFAILPGLPRVLDKAGGRRLAQIRVIASFGGPYLRSGGALYRFSIYERYLVVCFMTARSYPYEKVRVRDRFNKGAGSLSLTLDGLPVTLRGNSESLGRFSEALSKYVTLPGAES